MITVYPGSISPLLKHLTYTLWYIASQLFNVRMMPRRCVNSTNLIYLLKGAFLFEAQNFVRWKLLSCLSNSCFPLYRGKDLILIPYKIVFCKPIFTFESFIFLAPSLTERTVSRTSHFKSLLWLLTFLNKKVKNEQNVVVKDITYIISSCKI